MAILINFKYFDSIEELSEYIANEVLLAPTQENCLCDFFKKEMETN